MSERATYCTNYLFCTHCIEQLQQILPNSKAMLEGEYNYGYISGSFKAYYPTEEYEIFEKYLDTLIPKLDDHRIKITLTPEDAPTRIYFINKDKYNFIEIINYDN